MHQKPRRTLAKLVQDYGDELIHDPRRTQALLNDLCGKYSREIFVLIQAQRRRVPAELRAAPTWVPTGTTVYRLTQMLENQLSLTPEASAWAVESWAIALGLQQEGSQSPWYQRWPNQLLGKDSGNVTPEPAKTATVKQKSRQVSPLTRTGQKAASVVQSSADAGPASSVGIAPARAAKNSPRRTGGLPSYLRKQAPNAILWILVLLTSVGLGWAIWEDGGLTETLAALGGEPTSQPLQQVIPPPQVAPTPTQTPQHMVLVRLYTPPQPAVVLAADGLNVRAGPSLDATPVDYLQRGQSVTVVGYSADGRWAQLNTSNPSWASTDYLAFSTPNGREVRIRLQAGRIQPQLGPVTLHSEPSAGAPGVNTLAGGAEIVIVASTLDNNWLQIGAPHTGWVMSSAVELTPTAPAAPANAVGMQP